MIRSLSVAVLLAVLVVLRPVNTLLTRAAGPTALAGYTLEVFATGTSSYYNPDSMVTDGSSVFVGYQNNATNDGSSGSSTIVQYSLDGAVQGTFSVQGHNDGLRIDPQTGDLWSLSNEDANPLLTVITPSTGRETVYPLPGLSPLSGGYDDLAFTRRGTFISASNPGLNPQGINTSPAVARIELLSNDQVRLTPVLSGNAQATDRISGAQVQLNLTDPDSLAIDPATGDLVLNDQADAQLIFIHAPGTEFQEVSRLLLQPAGDTAPIVDETTWVPRWAGVLSFMSALGKGTLPARCQFCEGSRFLIADHSTPGTIYVLTKSGGFASGTVYTTVANDSPTLTSNVGTLDPQTGVITPVATGFHSPKGLLFLPQRLACGLEGAGNPFCPE